ncbi:immunoglobulin-like domain-containing protein [Lewinella sp. IMCC34191]|uniref:immunoglobulin-like domain-containing protein n=1 Tax=Lewinella sp. IMCC34191 TaxID=2259172 RepID=UPI0018E545BC|nr:immunoglobulin-like domain-containing protein [Lewinella sp. IMCC34191]
MTVGEEVTVVLQVDAGAQEIDGVEAYLNFDPDYITINSVEYNASAELPTVIISPTVDAAGEINVASGLLGGGSVSGTFNYVTINLTATAVGSTSIDFSFDPGPPNRKTEISFDGLPVLGTTSGSVLTITDSATQPVVTIGGPGAKTVSEGGSLQIPLSVTDQDGDALTVTITSVSEEPQLLQTDNGGTQKDPFPTTAEGFLTVSDITNTSGAYSANLNFDPVFGDGGGANGDGDGVYTITVTVSDGDNTITEPFTLTVTDEPQPLSPFAVTRIEAESFDNQGPPNPGSGNLGIGVEVNEGAATNIGFTHVGDFAEYFIDVPQAGTYDFTFLAAKSNSGTATMDLKVGGSETVLGSIDVTSTGDWQAYVPVTTSAELPAGPQTLRFEWSAGSSFLFNIDYFDVEFAEDAAPVVAIVQPDDGDSFVEGSTVTIIVEASDDVGVTGVELFDGSTSLGTAATAPYTFTIANFSGTYALTAVASDGSATTTSTLVTINSVVDNTTPVVAIVNPTSGATVTRGTNISLSGTVTDTEESGLAGELEWTSSDIQFSTNPVNGIGASITGRLVTPGSQAITASVTDNGGLTGSDAVIVTVSSPDVTLTSPGSGATVGSTNLRVEWTATNMLYDLAEHFHLYVNPPDLNNIDYDSRISTGSAPGQTFWDLGSADGITDGVNTIVIRTANQFHEEFLTDPNDPTSHVQDMVTFTVDASDATSPVITLLGDNPLELTVGEGYTELGATAFDDVDGDLTASIEIDDSAVDVTTVGSYAVQYSVSDAAGNRATTVRVVNVSPGLELPEPCENTLYRVNVGGMEVASADATPLAWSSDEGQFPDGAISPYLVANSTGGSTYNGDGGGAHPGEIVMTDPTVPASAPASVFNTERYDLDSDPEMKWEFPVAAGTEVQVTLLFAELFGQVDEAGLRVFDVAIEGTVLPAFDDIDPYAIAGPKGAFSRSATLTVTDGTLDIEFIHGVENPALKGIQICGISGGEDNTPPVVALQGDNPLNLTVGQSFTDPGATAFDNVDGDLTGSIVVNASGVNTNAVGSYAVNYSVSDAAGNTGNAVRIVNVSPGVELPDPCENTLYRINVGGDVLASSDATPLAWSADLGAFGTAGNSPYLAAMSGDGGIFSGTSGSAHSGNIIMTDPTVPASAPADVFNTERYDGGNDPEMKWEFPVAAGTEVQVTLLFAELFNGITGPDQRVFDVAIEGTVLPAFENIDPYAIAGPKGAFTRSATLTVTDGTLDIEFIHGVENPALKGIQICGISAADDITPPVIALQGANPLNLTVGDSYVDPGATASDNVDGDLSGSIVVGGDFVNTLVAGTYAVTYNVTDAAGNAATEVIRTVVVNPADFACAYVAIDPGSNDLLTASTFSDGLIITNNSQGQQITSVSFDLSTAIYPNMVFDPVGTAGDATAKCLTITSQTGGDGSVGLTVPGNGGAGGDPDCTAPFVGEVEVGNGGYSVLNLNFNDFEPGESVNLAIDIDPTSIEGFNGAGNAGAISGLELAGSTVTVEFSDGQTLTSVSGELFRIQPNSGVGSANYFYPGSENTAPDLTLLGASGTSNVAGFVDANVEEEAQTVRITGTPDAAVSLLVLESTIEDLGPGTFPGSFEANKAQTVAQFDAVVGSNGTVDIPVTLSDNASGNIYHLVAVQARNGGGSCENGFSNTSEVWRVKVNNVSGQPNVLIEVTPGAVLGASTYGGSDKFQITNQSTGNLQITGVSFDLSTGILPDMVFDPTGTGGDATAQCFTPGGTAAAVGLINPSDACTTPFGSPRNGGFDVLTTAYTDFDPGESFTFSVDLDPNSIQGVPGAGDAGAVSGYEITGATVTVTFSDGSTVVSSLYEDGSLGGGQAVVTDNAPAAPVISVVDVPSTPATVGEAEQTITVSGTPGDYVSLLIMDSRLFIASGDPPFDVADPTYYANEAMSGKAMYSAQIGAGGTVDIPVTLLATPSGNATPDGGLNQIVAVASSVPYAVDQPVSTTSNVITLLYDQTVPPFGQPSVLVEITPGAGLDATTYGGSDKIQITNQSTGNLSVTGVSIDLSTGILPDMVYDPTGSGGDATAQCFTAGPTAGTVGLVAPADPCVSSFSAPRNGGFDVLTTNFTDFDPGESFSMTTDIDPNSIQGVEGAGNAGAVSGYELIGATVTVTFSNGSTLVSSLYEDGSLGGAQAVVTATAPAAPTISVVGQPTTPATVSSASQVVTVAGTPGDYVSLLVMDSRLFIASGDPPFDVADETYYANEAMSGKGQYSGVIGSGGTVDIPVTLLATPSGNSTPNGGLNQLIAVTSSDPYAVNEAVSTTSNVITLRYDPDAGPADLTISVTRQGMSDYSGDYTVKLYPVGGSTPVYDLIGTANAAGEMIIDDIAPGTYELAIKYPNALQVVDIVTITSGGYIHDAGELLTGDINNNNHVNILDFSALVNSFGLEPGDAGYNPNANLDGTGEVQILDFSLLVSNFDVFGEIPSGLIP